MALAAGPLLLRRARSRALLALVAMASAGAFAMASKREQTLRHPVREPFATSVEASVCRAPFGERWLQLDLCALENVDPAPAARSLPKRVRVGAQRAGDSGSWLAGLESGDRVRARLRVRPTRGLRNPGGRDRALALARAGVGAFARLESPGLAVRLPERDRGAGPVAALRRAIEAARGATGARLADAGRGGALVRALAIGQRGALDPLDREAFARLGLSHLLAVSGLHLALVAGFAYACVRGLLLRATPLAEAYDVRSFALVGAFAVAAGYALVTGFGVPVRRALVLLAVVAVALASGRRRSAGHALAAGAIAVLAFDPAALFSPGAQLSFAASAALLLGRRARSEPGTREPIAYLGSSLRTSSTAIAATAPLVALHGGQVGAFALVANLVMVPWTALVLLPASLLAAATAALQAVLPAASGSLLHGVLTLCVGVANVSLAGVGAVAAALPQLSQRPAPALWAVAAASVLALGVLRAQATSVRVAIAVAVTLLLSFAPGERQGPAPPRVVGFEVGLGDATLVQSRRARVLVDTGRAYPDGQDLGRHVVLPGLRALGVERLDLMVVSHADLDHRGGAPSLLRSLPVGEVWIPPGGRREPAFRELLRVASERRVAVLERGAGDPPRRLGELRVVPLWPPREARHGSRNDRSLVVRIEIAGRRVLLAGDLGDSAERAMIEAKVDLRADLLKVGHHGSRGSSSGPFLRAVEPQIAIVSAPCGRGALPHRDALARLRQAGASLWWTGRDGAIFVALGDPLRAWSHSPRRRCD